MLGLALFALAVVALWFCYLRVSRTQRVESDGASIALQGWDVLHGNLLLHGWTVPDVSGTGQALADTRARRCGRVGG